MSKGDCEEVVHEMKQKAAGNCVFCIENEENIVRSRSIIGVKHG